MNNQITTHLTVQTFGGFSERRYRLTSQTLLNLHKCARILRLNHSDVICKAVGELATRLQQEADTGWQQTSFLPPV